MLARIIGWVVIAFIVFYLLTNPDGAAGFVHSFMDGLRQAGNSLSKFVSHL